MPRIDESLPCVAHEVSGRGDLGARVGRADHHDGGDDIGRRDHGHGSLEAQDLSEDGAERRAHDRRQNPAVGVDGVDALPERFRNHEREQAAQPAAAERSGQRRHAANRNEEPCREIAVEGQGGQEEQ